MARTKQECQVNLVRTKDGKSYRTVSDSEIVRMKMFGKVVAEKKPTVDTSRVGVNYFYSYWVEV